MNKMLMRPLDSDTDVYSVYESHEVEERIAELEAKNIKLRSCLKCLVVRNLIKDCPEKESAVQLLKEADVWNYIIAGTSSV